MPSAQTVIASPQLEHLKFAFIDFFSGISSSITAGLGGIIATCPQSGQVILVALLSSPLDFFTAKIPLHVGHLKWNNPPFNVFSNSSMLTVFSAASPVSRVQDARLHLQETEACSERPFL